MTLSFLKDTDCYTYFNRDFLTRRVRILYFIICYKTRIKPKYYIEYCYQYLPRLFSNVFYTVNL